MQGWKMFHHRAYTSQATIGYEYSTGTLLQKKRGWQKSFAKWYITQP